LCRYNLEDHGSYLLRVNENQAAEIDALKAQLAACDAKCAGLQGDADELAVGLCRLNQVDP
jgi:hypothetical protein